MKKGMMKMSFKGIDISEWQTPQTMNYDAIAEQVDFVILRIGYTGHNYGKDPRNFNKDRHFETHYKEFKKRGVAVGGYWYGGAMNTEEVVREHNVLLEAIKGKKFEYPIYYDVEENLTHGKLSRSDLTKIVNLWCSRLEERGYFVGIYASLHWFNHKMNDVSRYTKWLAQWGVNSPSQHCDVWQYTEDGNLRGYFGRLDMNISYVDFKKIIVNGGFNGFNGKEEVKEEERGIKVGDKIAYSTIYNDAWGSRPGEPYFTENVDGLGNVGVAYVVTKYEKKGSTAILGLSTIKDGEIIGWTKPVNVYRIL